jgi:hypothetical protein
MSEPNPYESPREPNHQSSLKAGRDGPSLAFILIVSPLIAILAGVLGVWLSAYTIYVSGDGPGRHEGLLMLIGLGSAAAAFAIMVRYAQAIGARRRLDTEQPNNKTANNGRGFED